MDAATLSNLSRSEIVSLAKANGIKANLSTVQIIQQLLQLFPNGVPALPSEGTPVSTATRLVGRVKGAFKAIKRSVKPLLPSVQPEATSRGPPESAVAPATEDELAIPPGTLVNRSSFYALPNSTFSEVPPSRSSFSDEAYSDSDDELMMDDLQPADPEDLRLVVADMEAMAAKNKEHLAKAAAVRARASELAAEAQNLRAMLEIEKTRRVRMEDYFKHWREMDPEWSYKAVWEGPVTVAPVLARYEGLKGGFLLDQEVCSSDDEELVGQWHRQDGVFRARRKARKGRKAKQRGVPVEAVSDDELASDEDEFYNPPVLREPNDDNTTPDSQHYVYPLMDVSDNTTSGILFGRPGDYVPHGTRTVTAKRARVDELVESEADKERYSHEERVAKWKEHQRRIGEALGAVIDDKFEGLGTVTGGWRVSASP